MLFDSRLSLVTSAGTMAFDTASYSFRHGAYLVGLQYPWERGVLGVVMGSRDVVELPFMRVPEWHSALSRR